MVANVAALQLDTICDYLSDYLHDSGHWRCHVRDAAAAAYASDLPFAWQILVV
jgi:hypothetical protein